MKEKRKERKEGREKKTGKKVNQKGRKFRVKERGLKGKKP